VSSSGHVTKKQLPLCLQLLSISLYSHWWNECTHVEKVKMADSHVECKYPESMPQTMVMVDSTIG
jgi:hypothetical protein